MELVFDQDVTLAPGEYAVVVRDEKEFRTVYGEEPRILGVFEGSLGNERERISLLTPEKDASDSFLYSDIAPWPRSPDGLGPSLERICSGTPSARPSTGSSIATFRTCTRW